MPESVAGFLRGLSKRQDLLLVVILILIIFMMILRLPPLLMDMLIAVNMSIAVVLLLVAIYLKSPTDFSTLPTVLLIATLFRLSISISTTRLILLEGNAGKIVETFGQFVVSGNLVVGLVIFLIITIVQFLVITKGSERVAEVSARFTLDAMPGKQMSIDADMRGGVIDINEAKARRQKLEKESQLFGAMDGAMKFVKGDAIAGLIITAVNILGGVTIGVAQQGMPMGEALEIYSILTIGDGLVSQIPALFLSVATGTVVTRVQGKEEVDLGTDIGQQLIDSPKTLQISSIVLVGFAMIPGFPTVIFLILAGAIGSAGFITARNRKMVGATSGLKWPDFGDPSQVPVVLTLGNTLHDKLSPPDFHEFLAPIKQQFLRETGISFPAFAVIKGDLPTETGCVVELEAVPVGQAEIQPDAHFFEAGREALDLAGIELADDRQDIHLQAEGVWLAEGEQKKLTEIGFTPAAPEQVLARHLAKSVRGIAHELIGVQETRKLLDDLSGDFGELVDEALKVVPLQKTTEILKRLVAEDVSIHSLRRILEALVEWGNKEKDPILLSEYVRSSLSRQITNRHTDGNSTISAILLTPDVEDLIRESTRKTAVGSYLVLPPDQADVIVNNLKAQLQSGGTLIREPVVLSSMDVRRHFRTLLENEGMKLPVLSYQELESEIAILPRGLVTGQQAAE